MKIKLELKKVLIVFTISFFCMMNGVFATDCSYFSEDDEFAYSYKISNIENEETRSVVYTKYKKGTNESSDEILSDYSIDFTSCVSNISVDTSNKKIIESDTGDFSLVENGQEEDWSGVFDDTSDSNRADFMIQDYVTCGGTGGNILIKNIPKIIPSISSSLYNTVMVVVPVIMILFGMIDLLKGIISQKDDEIRKGRSSFVKRTIMGVVTFLIVLLVKMLINLIGGAGNASRIINCVDCFVSNECDPQ